MDKAQTARWTRAAELLERVLELPAGEQERSAAEWGATHGVAEELDALLAASRGRSVLDDPLDEILLRLPSTAQAPNALKGQVLGQWELGDEIGKGGMSVVYHASRTGQDFEQHAALKIMSVAHLGEDFVASFLRERQILSDLHHPGIARLIDGGITPDGAPFLVMQYVNGERIDRWCRACGADLETVAGLMLKLCHAVAYAQRRLVVHQDINPSNVLVDEHGQPVLIDFGIARMLDPADPQRALQAFTPNYAAPEQTSRGAITTATDVYALGTLFQELAGDHRLDADLDAILRAATHEDPEQRYANARQLAGDLQAWRERRPVLARPNTLRYRAERFVARNRVAVAAASLVLLSLLGGLGAALYQARIAEAERDLAQAQSARAAEVTAFLQDLFRATDPNRAQGEQVTARELLDQGAYQLRSAFDGSEDLKTEMLVLLGNLYRELGELEAAGPLLRQGLDLAETLEDDRQRVEALRGAALLHMETGDHEQALVLLERAEDLLRAEGAVPGEAHARLMQPVLFSLAESGRAAEAAERGETALRLARTKTDLSTGALFDYLYAVSNVMLIAERAADAERLLREASGLAVGARGDPVTRIELLSNLAGVLGRRGDLETALEYRQQALALTERIYPPGHSQRARKLSNLGSELNGLGRYAEAEEALRQALSIYDEIYGGAAHPRVAAAHNNLGRALQVAGRYEAAEPHLTIARDMAREVFGADDARFLIATSNLGDLQRRLGKLDRSETLLTESLEMSRANFGPDHRFVGMAQSMLASLRLAQHRYAEALQLCEQAIELYRRIDYRDPRTLIATQGRRARALAGLGRYDEAESAFEVALGIGEEAGPTAGSQWPELLSAHAEYLLRRDDPRAPQAIERALAVHKSMLGEAHPATRRIERMSRGDAGAVNAGGALN